MAELQFGTKTFPWEMFAQTEARKDKNKQNLYQNIAGLGQGLGTGLQAVGDYEKHKKWTQTIDQLMQDPSIPAQYKQLGGVLKQVGPDQGVPIIQGLIRSQGKLGQLGQGKRVVYQAEDGSVSLSPKEGSIPMEVSDAQAMQYTAVPASRKESDKARETWANAWRDRIKFNQIDMLAKNTGLTTGQRNILQQNNMRANRAIEIASRPMTWQEFQAVLTDAGAIMQGGVPHIDQIHNMAYPSWKQDLARAQTYIQSTPQATVPEEFKNRVIGMVQGIQKIDNQYLEANAKFMKEMLIPTIEGGKRLEKPINQMTGALTQSAQPNPSFGQSKVEVTNFTVTP